MSFKFGSKPMNGSWNLLYGYDRSHLFSACAWKAEGKQKHAPRTKGEERNGEDGVVSWLNAGPQPLGFTPSSKVVALTEEVPTQTLCICLSSLFRGLSLSKLSLLLTKPGLSPSFCCFRSTLATAGAVSPSVTQLERERLRCCYVSSLYWKSA